MSSTEKTPKDKDTINELHEIALKRRNRQNTVRKRKIRQLIEQPHLEDIKKLPKEFPSNQETKYLLSGESEMQGRRPFMEDAMCMKLNFRNNEKESFFGVYDGHGGTMAATEVGAELHNVFSKKLTIFENFEESIEEIKKKNSDKKEINLVHERNQILCKRINRYLHLSKSENNSLFNQLNNSESNSENLSPSTKKKRPNLIENSVEVISIDSLCYIEAVQVLLRESFLELNESFPNKKITHGATASVLYLNDNHCFVANCGDTRVVLSRNGKAERLSFDHKPSDEDEIRRIKELGGFVSGKRVNGVLAVSRAIGDNFLEPMVTADPYTSYTKLKKTDDFIIIACDGVWDVVSDQDAVDLVRKEEDPRVASIKLRNHAFNEGSTDNISCIVIKLKQKK